MTLKLSTTTGFTNLLIWRTGNYVNNTAVIDLPGEILPFDGTCSLSIWSHFTFFNIKLYRRWCEPEDHTRADGYPRSTNSEAQPAPYSHELFKKAAIQLFIETDQVCHVLNFYRTKHRGAWARIICFSTADICAGAPILLEDDPRGLSSASWFQDSADRTEEFRVVGDFAVSGCNLGLSQLYGR